MAVKRWRSPPARFAPVGEAVLNEEAVLTEFRLTGRLEYLTWFHALGLLWITEFILACQQMTVAGAVVTYYFTRSVDVAAKRSHRRRLVKSSCPGRRDNKRRPCFRRTTAPVAPIAGF